MLVHEIGATCIPSVLLTVRRSGSAKTLHRPFPSDDLATLSLADCSAMNETHLLLDGINRWPATIQELQSIKANT